MTRTRDARDPDRKAAAPSRRIGSTLCALLLGFAAASAPAGGDWRPEEWEDGSTLSFQTVGSDYSEQWSTAWYVVLHGDVYVRLGASAADLIEDNIKRPYVKVRIGGQTFADVRADPANDMARTVDEAMADKYPMDFLFRFLPHPMVVRLRAASFH
jgi:hypothetical protein